MSEVTQERKLRFSLDELERITQILFKHLRDSGKLEFELTDDHYWHISKDERYNPEATPKALDLGQLTDDLSQLRKVASGQSEPLAFDLTELASILTFVGEEIVG